MSAINRYVREFHETYDCDISDVPTVGSVELRQLRIDLLQEELDEFAQACGASWNKSFGIWIVDPKATPDIVEMADAIGDIKYVAEGADIAFGFPSEAILEEIHRSNMSKLDAEGKVVAHPTVPGKVGKSDLYSKPDIARILGVHNA